MFWDSFYSLCLESGKTPNKVAKELHIPSGSITAWKKGSVPHPKTIQKIANYFDTTVEKLLGKEENPQPLSVDLGHGEIKKPAFNESELNSDLIKRMVRLTPEEVALVDAYIQGLLASREEKFFPDK